MPLRTLHISIIIYFDNKSRGHLNKINLEQACTGMEVNIRLIKLRIRRFHFSGLSQETGNKFFDLNAAVSIYLSGYACYCLPHENSEKKGEPVWNAILNRK